MFDEERLLKRLMESLTNGDVAQIRELYHPEMEYQDEVFGTLDYNHVVKMWEMIIAHKPENHVTIDYAIHTEGPRVWCEWKATYLFGTGAKKRPVVNTIITTIKIMDGRITRQIDTFDFRAWARQALGMKATLLGHTNFFRNQVSKTANNNLAHYMATGK